MYVRARDCYFGYLMMNANLILVSTCCRQWLELLVLSIKQLTLIRRRGAGLPFYSLKLLFLLYYLSYTSLRRKLKYFFIIYFYLFYFCNLRSPNFHISILPSFQQTKRQVLLCNVKYNIMFNIKLKRDVTSFIHILFKLKIFFNATKI